MVVKNPGPVQSSPESRVQVLQQPTSTSYTQSVKNTVFMSTLSLTHHMCVKIYLTVMSISSIILILSKYVDTSILAHK